MGALVPPSVVAAFTFGGTPDVDYAIIPVASQVGVSPELASFVTGFPPATRMARTSGGIPPRGLDMNGILFMTTGHIAWMSGGNGYVFNDDVVTVAGGYNVGAILRSAVNPAVHFFNTQADNITDPDDVGALGWLPFNPVSAGATGDQSVTATAGANAVALDSIGVAFLDVDTTAGAADITDLTGAANGQIVTVTNGGPNSLDVSFVPGGLTILSGESFTARYRASVPTWVPIS